MSALRELYQEVIIDHNCHPRHFHVIENSTHQAEGFNPLCGDQLTLYLKIENDVITKASFQGTGCAISTASASLMTDSLMGKTIEEAQKLFDQFHTLMTNEDTPNIEDLGKLKVLEGVREFPSRIKCATLAFHTLKAALRQQHQVASTE